MSPTSPIARALLSLLFVFHLTMVSVYVWPDVAWQPPGQQLAKTWIRTLNLRQSWNMFRNPSKWNRFLDHEGLRADGTVVVVVPNREPPPGAFLRMTYERELKLQHNIASGAKAYPSAMGEYVDWVCRQAPEDVVGLRLVKRSERHLSPREWQEQPDKERQQRHSTIWEGPCPP